MNKSPDILKRTAEVAGVTVAALALSVLHTSSAEALTNNDIEKNPSLLYGALYSAVDASPTDKVIGTVGQRVKESASFTSLDGDTINVTITHPKDSRGALSNGYIKVEEFDAQTKRFESGVYVVNKGGVIFVTAVKATEKGSSIFTNISGNEASAYPRDDLTQLARISGNLLLGVQSENRTAENK